VSLVRDERATGPVSVSAIVSTMYVAGFTVTFPVALFTENITSRATCPRDVAVAPSA
jgi:hypothetical protein